MTRKPVTFDVDRFLRAVERVQHAELAKQLRTLLSALGYNNKTQQFANTHAQIFHAAMVLYPSTFLEYVASVLAGKTSSVAEDYLREEGLAILNIVLRNTITMLRNVGGNVEMALAENLESIADEAVAAWEGEKGSQFSVIQQIGKKFTLDQARTYIRNHAATYNELPG